MAGRHIYEQCAEKADHNRLPASLAGSAGWIARFDFSPDNETIYFTVSVSEDFSDLDLFKIDLRTQLPVCFIGRGLGGNYAISPNGACLTISRPYQLDVYCSGDEKPQRIFDFGNECGFGAHAGPDVHWKSDSSGFYVVTPKCNGNVLSGRLILQEVELAKVPLIAASTFKPGLYDFIDSPEDYVDFGPKWVMPDPDDG